MCTIILAKFKEVSVRRMKPTEPEIDLTLVFEYAHNWNTEWENDGSVHVFDEGIAQYLLCGKESHHKFYASLVLNKPCLRCSVVEEEPEDDLDDIGNRFRIVRNVY